MLKHPDTPPHIPAARCAAGFTLIEMMITLVIAAILLAIAVPSFRDATLGSRLSSFANSFVSSALLARSEAIKRNTPVTLCISSDGTTCGAGDWEQGWIVTVGGEVLHRYQALPDGFKITASGGATAIDFQPTGIGVSWNGTLTVCRAAPNVGNQERVITVGPTGKPSMITTNNSTCP